MMMNSNNELSIRAKWGISEDKSQIRMEWTLTSRSNKVVIVDGYRIIQGSKSFLDAQRKEKKQQGFSSEINQSYLSNAHLHTILWPGETRSYIWSFVYPDYYGVSQETDWGYFVIIRYRDDSTREFLYSMSNISVLTPMIETRRTDSRTLYSALAEEIAEFLKAEELQEITKVYTDYRISHLGIVDIVIETGDAIIAIEYSKTVNKFKISQLNRYLDWFSFGMDKRLLGILLVDEPYPDDHITIIPPKGASIFIARLTDRRLEFVRIHSE
jgi:hypothetical protein